MEHGATYTWKKTENSNQETKMIDYMFTNIKVYCSFEITETDLLALYGNVNLEDI